MLDQATSPRPRWWQFTIMRLLVLTAFCAIGLAWWQDHAALQKIQAEAETLRAAADKQRLVADLVRQEAEARLQKAHGEAVAALERSRLADRQAMVARERRLEAERRLKELLSGFRRGASDEVDDDSEER